MLSKTLNSCLYLWPKKFTIFKIFLFIFYFLFFYQNSHNVYLFAIWVFIDFRGHLNKRTYTKQTVNLNFFLVFFSFWDPTQELNEKLEVHQAFL